MKMKKKIGLAVVLALIVAGIGLFLAYYNTSNRNVWFDNTVINGVDVSGQTLEQSKETLTKALNDYTLNVKGRNNGKFSLKGEDIQFKLTLSDKINQLFKNVHNKIAFPYAHSKYKVDYSVSYDKSAVAQAIDESEIVNGSDNYEIVNPRSAFIMYDEKKHDLVVSSGIDGNKIVKKEFKAAVNSAIGRAVKTLSIDDNTKYSNIYKNAKATVSKKDLQKVLPEYRELAMKFIKWDMGDNITEELNPQEIADMLSYKDGKVLWNDEKITEWTEAFAQKYKTVGTKRTYKSHTGAMLSTAEGDYGFRLEWDKTLAQVKKALKKKMDQSDVDAYAKKADDDTKKAITVSLKPIWYSKGYKLNLENKAEDWNSTRYFEVDMKEQKAYFIQNGKVVYSTNCITGKPEGKRKTTTGAYWIKQRQLHRVLKGDGYSTPVTYWVRITWTGTGFHAAPWQSWGSWSPSYYLSRGSHGCVNLPGDAAVKIYNLAQYGDMVFMHY
jgi:lipoprotein-anchoring transpeptidase ErfK/SrfK